MRAIVFLLMAISCNELGFAQDYDDVFEHSAADTVSNSTDTMSMGHSKTLVFQTITLRDTNKSHDGLQYFQVIKISDPVGGRLVQEIADSGHSTHEIEFDDFNSDGYKDLHDSRRP